MLPLVVTLAVGLLLLWGAYRLGQRFPFGALCGTALLFGLAWRLLQVDTSYGEGAAAGVAIIAFVVWAGIALSFLLAITMLLGTIRAHDSIAAKIALGLLVPIAALMVQRRMALNHPGAAAARASPPSEPPAPRVEGYTWAIDEGVIADSSCHGDSMFVAGCKAGVARNLGH
jgi:hypothetical protein